MNLGYSIISASSENLKYMCLVRLKLTQLAVIEDSTTIVKYNLKCFPFLVLYSCTVLILKGKYCIFFSTTFI